ncbi:MAG: glucose-6-phosphate isomerase [Steroidobacteraceae bacterium]
MPTATRAGVDTPAWTELTTLAARMQRTPTAALFAADPQRFTHCSVQAGALLLDYSRQRVDAAVLAALLQLPELLGLRERIAAMFEGAIVNSTEQRAVLHTALRRRETSPLRVGGADVMPEVLAERARMLQFATGVREGTIRGSSGASFDLVVNIGIGGSDLGPAMAARALSHHAQGAPRLAFVSNVDGCHLCDVLAGADPVRTLFIVCSKTFTTLETLSNARKARAWLVQQLGESAVPDHFAAVSVNEQAMNEFGVHPQYRFAMWDWVGGRYSVWSAIGVSLAIALGAEGFEQFLAGAAAIDAHFREAPWAGNLPVLMALLGIWNINFLQLPSLAILPYDDRLQRLPAYLQQLEMESNGKSVRVDGSVVGVATCPVIWGEPGNNAQHSFFQLLHQGSHRAALDLLMTVNSSCADQSMQDLAIANCLAQAEAFAFGQTAEQVRADLARQTLDAEQRELLVRHKVHEGSRPVSLLMVQRLDPGTLGQLLALYEHKVFVQGVVWGVNSFDQWGVELGKKLCERIVPLVRAGAAGPDDTSSLRGALDVVRRWRGTD